MIPLVHDQKTQLTHLYDQSLIEIPCAHRNAVSYTDYVAVFMI